MISSSSRPIRVQCCEKVDAVIVNDDIPGLDYEFAPLTVIFS
jgi:hypothetical protein